MVANAELWAGLVWLALGAFVAWSGHDLGVGRVNDPGPGFLLFWAGLIACGLAGAVAVQAARRGGASLASLWSGARWRKAVLVLACLAVYALLFDRLGFLLATVPLMLVLLRAVEPVRWRVALPVAVLSTTGVWWVLKRVLLIQLPSGIFEIG